MNHKSNKRHDNPVNRRDFLKAGSVAGLGLALGGIAPAGCARDQSKLTGPAPFDHFAAPPLDTVKVGFVGIGNQGSGHFRNLLKIEGVEMKAVCDIRAERLDWAQNQLKNANMPPAVEYNNGVNDFKRMCDTEELDLVYTATPWEFHVPVTTYAMQTGSHAATEIPGAITLDQCWQVIEYSEKYKKHCCTMENCCYDKTELLILNLVRQKMFGDLLHAECGYLHDLRGYKFGQAYYPNDWRLQHSIKRDADLYPCHGLGPVAQWMDITRGNKFEYLVSMSSPSLCLHEEAVRRYGPDHELSKIKYALGDVVNTLIKTSRGPTILVTHDTNTPRPYSRKVLLQGTKGLVRKYPEEKIHLEERSRAHAWEDLAEYHKEFEHPLLTALREQSAGAGHGGMDFIEDFRLIQCLREGKPVDMDTYDGMTISSVVALSEKSITNGSAPVECPDFTRGRWKTRTPLPIVTL